MSDVFRLYAPDELGEDGYPPEWHATIKHAVREEAGHRCIRCGHPYTTGKHRKGDWTPCDWQCSHLDPIRVRPILADNWQEIDAEGIPAGQLVQNLGVPMFVEAQWRILTVHHLDGDKANCRWWNLAALCQRCHLTIQGKVYLEREYVREHSAWFKPYAAAWYAFRYLGQDLTREQTIRRLDELLDLEFRQPRLEGIS